MKERSDRGYKQAVLGMQMNSSLRKALCVEFVGVESLFVDSTKECLEVKHKGLFQIQI